MKDTPDDIMAIQRDIFLKMSPKERWMQGIQMIEDVRKIVENSLRIENPEATEAELKVLLFQRYYAHELPEAFVAECSQRMLDFWQKKLSENPSS